MSPLKTIVQAGFVLRRYKTQPNFQVIAIERTYFYLKKKVNGVCNNIRRRYASSDFFSPKNFGRISHKPQKSKLDNGVNDRVSRAPATDFLYVKVISSHLGMASDLLFSNSSRTELPKVELEPNRTPGFELVMYRVQLFRVRVEYESVGVEYESSTSRVLRIHSQIWGSSL